MIMCCHALMALITAKAVEVFGADRAQAIDIGEPMYSGWQLASDGRTLVAATQASPTSTTSWISTVYLWDLTRPGSPPRTITLAPETLAVIADDASIVLAPEAKGIRVMRPREGTEKLLKYRGRPAALSAWPSPASVSRRGVGTNWRGTASWQPSPQTPRS